MGSDLAFFKCIRSYEKLEISPAFVTQIRGAIANNIILRDRYKNTWLVQVGKSGERRYFSKGWAEFCSENSVECGDFMVFEYKSENLFDFTMFGGNACEKEGVGAPKIKVEVDTDDESMAEKEEEEEEEEEGGQKVCIGTIPCKRKHKKKDLPDYYGADIFASGLASKPKNPYFVTRSRCATRKNQLYIPTDVIVDYNISIPERAFVVDDKGTKWETKMRKWNDGRVVCSRGWKNLCNVNGINHDDTCIIEFVQQQGTNNLLLLVHVVDML